MTSLGNHYLTPTELITRWRDQVKTETLASWRCRGGGPDFVKIGGRVLYTVAAVEDYEQKQTRK